MFLRWNKLQRMAKIPRYTLFIYRLCVSDYNIAYKYLSDITITYIPKYLNLQLFGYQWTYKHMKYLFIASRKTEEFSPIKYF